MFSYSISVVLPAIVRFSLICITRVLGMLWRQSDRYLVPRYNDKNNVYYVLRFERKSVVLKSYVNKEPANKMADFNISSCASQLWSSK